MRLEDMEKDDSHPVFAILRKVMKFIHENKFEELISEKNPKKIDWVMKPLEESGAGLMQYRVIAILDGKTFRIEKNDIFQPSSFSKREAEVFISKVMDNHPEIEQNVELKKMYRIDTTTFERVSSKRANSM